MGERLYPSVPALERSVAATVRARRMACLNTSVVHTAKTVTTFAMFSLHDLCIRKLQLYFNFEMGQEFGRVKGAVSALAALVSLASAVPFGLQIYPCTTPGVIALGFDDGP